MRAKFQFFGVIFLILGFWSQTVFAAGTQEVLLVSGTTNAIKKHSNANFNLWFLTDSETGAALGLKASGSLVNSRYYPVSKFASGVPLVQMRTKPGQPFQDIVVIQSEDFRPDVGGVFEISYLTNGLFGTWGSVTVQLVREQDGWKMLMDGQNGWTLVRNIFIEKNSVFGNVIGIRSISGRD